MLHKLLTFFGIALTIGAPTHGAINTSQSPYPPIQLAETPPEQCGFDRIMIGPNGAEIAVWGSERDHLLAARSPPPFALLAIGRMNDRGSGNADRFLTYFGPDLAIPIRWSSDGKTLYARATRDRIITFTFGESRAQERGRLAPEWKYVDLRATTHGDLSELEKPEWLGQAKRIGTDFYRGHATLGDEVTFIGARTGDLQLVRIVRELEAPPLLRASYTRWILGFPNEKEFEGGIAYVGATGKDKLRYLPYQRPLVDLATGRVAGKFNGTEIHLKQETGFETPLAQFRRKQAEGGIILDASLSGGTLILLILSGRGEVNVSRLGTHGLTQKTLCSTWPRIATTPAGMPLAPGDNVKLRIFGIDRSGRESYAPGLPIAILHQAGMGPGRDAVVSFNGGPTGSLADSPMARLRLLAPERDFIAVDYSGSVGGGLLLTRRLTEKGLGAIEEDVDALVRWLDRRGYRRIFLEGGSFGGIPAMIALSRYPSKFAASFMPAPLLRLRDSGEWANRGDLQRTSATGQRAFEEAMFGGPPGRARFAADLSRLVARTPLRSADRFVFSSDDPTSQPGDLPSGHKATIRVTRGPHGAIASQDAYFEEVIDAMQTGSVLNDR